MRLAILAIAAALAASPVVAQSSDVREVHRIIAADTAQRQRVLDRSCAKLGKVEIGMTQAEVLKTCWGKPDSINRTVTASRDHQQWVYGARQYLYFDDGVVTAVQQSR